MSRSDEEDEDNGTTAGPRGRPNAWFADHDRDYFESGAFRGVPTGPHGGSASVTPDDTGGSYEHCWCGLPFDHDWPGKSLGAPHPQKESSMSPTDSTAPRIERRQLRAYHADLVDVILTAVNQYGVKYRLTGTKILLFPPDGTGPLTINAANSDRQRRKVQQWFVRHCVPLDKPIKRAQPEPKEVSPESVKELAEQLDSEEHLPKLDEPAKPAKKAAPAPAKKAAAPQPPAEEPVTPQPEAQPEWVPYMLNKDKGGEKKHPFYLFNTRTGQVKCTIDGEILHGPKSTGGHTRTHHTDTTSLWGPAAKEKGTNTYFTNKANAKIASAIELLQDAIGVEPAADTSELQDELTAARAVGKSLQAEITALKAEVKDLKQQIADRDAKAQLAREALGL